jgi:hypothetical protein
MATYATAADLGLYVLDNPGVVLPTDPDAVERLLERAERDVDAVLGAWPLFASGLKIDPAQLDVVQQAALARATCAAAEFRLVLGEEALVGDEDYLPSEVTILRRAANVSPKMLQELAGTGLVKRSGTALPDPPTPTWPVTPLP